MATAAPDDSSVAEMESLLTCSICLKTLKDPRTLGCFHSYCKFCLEKYVKEQREKAAEKVIEAFDCPVCTSKFSLKQGEQVEGMLPNHFIKNQLEVHAIQCRAKELPCFFCESEASAVSRCTTCDQYLCSKCLTAHQNWPGFKKHIVLTMDELIKPENQEKARGKLLCQKHENMPCELYCQTCKEFVCEYCTESIKHAKPDHSYHPLAELFRKPERESLNASSAILDAELNGGKKALQEIENITQLLKKNAEKTKNDIIQHKQEIIKQEQEALKVLIQKIEDKATLLMNEVDQKYNEVYEPLVKQKTGVETFIKKVKRSVKLTKNLLEKGSPEEILSLQKEIDENVEKVKSERPCPMKPVHDGDVQYKVKETQTDTTQYSTSILNKLGEVVCNPPAGSLLCQQSVILNANNEYGTQMEEWLGKQFQWRLCYRASRDGWQTQDFHRCCDNKGPTVTLVKVGNYICGEYTDQNWAGQGECKQSNCSFLFSIKNKDNIPAFRSNIQNKQYAIYSNPGYGPTFGGGHDFHVSNNPHLSQQSYSNLGYSYQPQPGYQYNTAQSKSLLAGSHKFTVTEMEVFY